MVLLKAAGFLLSPCSFSFQVLAFRGAVRELLGCAEAAEKVHNFRFGLNSAVTFRKWLRFPRGDLEPPRALPCGVSSLSLLPRWSLRHLLQSTARSHPDLYVFSFSVASLRLRGLPSTAIARRSRSSATPIHRVEHIILMTYPLGEVSKKVYLETRYNTLAHYLLLSASDISL